MAGLAPAIHTSSTALHGSVDGRVKPGHDDESEYRDKMRLTPLARTT
jgi:hypothetical protein